MALLESQEDKLSAELATLVVAVLGSARVNQLRFRGQVSVTDSGRLVQ